MGGLDRVRPRPHPVARRDRAAAAAGGDAARGARDRLQPRRRARAGRVRDRDERRRRPAARRGQGGWDSPDGRALIWAIAAAGVLLAIQQGVSPVLARARRADLAAGRRDRPRPARGRVGRQRERSPRSRIRSCSATSSEAGGNLEFNPFTPGRAVSGLVALINRYVPVVAAAMLDRRRLLVARRARDPRRLDADPLRHAPRARGRERDVAREHDEHARGVVLPRARARAAGREGAADLRARAVGAGPPPRRVRALVGHALADAAPALHDADGARTRSVGAALRGRRARRARPRGRERRRLAARHRVRAPGRRDHRARRGVLHGEPTSAPSSACRPTRRSARSRRRRRRGTRPVGSGSRSADGLPRESIRFEGVSFAYPGSERPVLDGLDLEIPAGGSLAIVGLNGAGKTTLIKLLARLYEPTAGRITVDGVDVRELDLASWRSRIAAIFQDFVHYELPVADNIGLGSVAHLGDEPAILRAAQRAGATRGDRGAAGRASRRRCRRATPAASTSRAGSGSASRSPARSSRSSRARRCSCSTSRPRTSTSAPRPSCSTASSRSRAARRRSSSRTASRPCGAPTASSCSTTARSSRRERHDELVARGGRYAELFRLQAARFALDEEGDDVRRWVDVRPLPGRRLAADRPAADVRRSSALVLVTAVSVPLFALGTKAFVNAAAAGNANRAMVFGALVGVLWIASVAIGHLVRPVAFELGDLERPRLRRGADRARRRLGRPRAPREPGVREPARARALRRRRPVPRDALPREPRRASCSSC